MNTLSPRAQEGNTSFVYSLIDPRDGIPFYIGITVNLYERFKQHMRCDGTNVQKDARVQEIFQAGFIPIMNTLEQVAIADASDREIYWIRHYLMQGINLLNITSVPRNQPPGKPQSMTLVPEGFIRYSTDRFLTKLYFKTASGDMVRFADATSKQFVDYIRQYVNFDWEDAEDIVVPDGASTYQLHRLPNGRRCQILNQIRILGIPMEYYNVYGELIEDQIGHPFRKNMASEAN